MTGISLKPESLDADEWQGLRQRLLAGAEQLDVSLNGDQCERLLAYASLFFKWNRAYNLSAIRDLAGIVDRHLIDSLAIVPQLPRDATSEGRVLDVGTGGGLPGIPLAILRPNWSLTLLDSNGKKTRFLFQVANELGLSNVTVVNDRVERYQPSLLFDAIVSRAFASLADMHAGCRHLLAEGGQLWAMKGVFPQEELAAVDADLRVTASHRLQVPGSDGERHLLILSPRDLDTPRQTSRDVDS